MTANRLLPVGSVVLLRGGIKKLMIIGVMPIIKEPEIKLYDYVGVLYPEGFLNNQTGNYLFNHSDINDIVFLGYQNLEQEVFSKMISIRLDDIISTDDSKDTRQ